MSGPILVTGGTGTLGRLVVARLLDAGRDVRVLTRQTSLSQDGVQFVHGDLDTGEGLGAAVAGIHTVVHCAGTATGDGEKTRRLTEPALPAGVQHLVFISVVGAEQIPVVSALDRAMFGYFASKRAAERVVMEAGLPWTTLRATQFHDLILTTVRQLSRLPVIPVPAGFRFQPVASTDVAATLVQHALGAPSGLVPDLAGPQVHGMAALVRSYLRASGRHRLILPIHVPGQAARAIRCGANLAPDRAAKGGQTWEDFLAARTTSRAGGLGQLS